jgi:deoxyribose-phosphate aldolase
MLDCTLTNPTASLDELHKMLATAKKYHFHTVLGPRCFNELIVKELAGTSVLPCSGCSATLGHDPTEVKTFHARLAVSQGIKEIDMVMNLSYLKSGLHKDAIRDIASVKQAVESDIPVKCIIEAPLLTDEEIVTACKLVMEGGAEFVKTASGLRGATTLHHVELIKNTIDSKTKIKAASGIRDAKTIQRMIDMGVERFGISYGSVLKIIGELGN